MLKCACAIFHRVNEDTEDTSQPFPHPPSHPLEANNALVTPLVCRVSKKAPIENKSNFLSRSVIVI